MSRLPLARLQLFTTGATMLVVLAILELARSVHYLFFHTLVEIFAVVVSLSIFILTWASHRYLASGYLIVLGAASGAIGLLDIVHALTFKGMNVFPGVSLNYTNQFWLTARFLEALALLFAPLMLHKKPNIIYLSSGFFALATLASIAVVTHQFPATFIEGVGLSPFKIYSEYAIISLMLAALILLYQRKAQFQPRIFTLLVAFLLFTIAAEFCFTQYVGFYDFSHALGHYFRFVSSVLALTAIVISGVRQPLELLFREIADKQEKLKSVNNQLVESDSLLNRAQQVAKIGSWYLNIPQRTLTCSDETYRIFGEALGSPMSAEIISRHIHAEDLPGVQASWNAALHTGQFDIEHRIAVGGEIRWVREVAEITFAPDGSPAEAFGTVHDITDRKQIERQLHEVEERYSLAFKLSPDAININRLADGLYLDVNPAFLQMSGWRREEVIGKSSIELGIWHDLADRQRLVASLSDSGRCNNLEANFVMKDGTLITALMSAHIMTLAGESCILSVTRDISERKQIEQALEENREKYRALSEAAFEAIFITENGIGLEQNNQARKMFGYEDAEIMHIHATELIVPEDRAIVMQHIAEQYEQPYEVTAIRKNGNTFPIIVRSKTTHYRGRTVRVTSIRDISERKQNQLRMERLLNEQKAMLESGLIGFVKLAERKIQWVNPTFEKMMGYALGELIGTSTRIHYLNEQAYLDLAAEAYPLLTAGQIYRTQIEFSRKDGEHIWVELSGVNLNAGESLWAFLDITERVQLQSQIEHMAHYDALTQLPNRALFRDRLRQALSVAKRSNDVVALMFLDLDHFKAVNDTYGHQNGDLLLQQVAGRVKNCVRESDTVARLAGDEFTVILPEITSADDAARVAEKIVAAFAAPFDLDGEQIYSSTSIGIALFPQHATDEDKLLNLADSAMYTAKQSGKNQFVFFSGAEQNQ